MKLISQISDSVRLGRTDPTPCLVRLDETSWPILDICNAIGITDIPEVQAVRAANAALDDANADAWSTMRLMGPHPQPDARLSAESKIDVALRDSRKADSLLADYLSSFGFSASESRVDAEASSLVVYRDGKPVVQFRGGALGYATF